MIEIWTDGSNSPKGPDLPIGYAAIVRLGGMTIELAAWCSHGTNNTAELKAAIIGLQALNPVDEMIVRTDSQYVLNQAMGNHKTKANKELVAILQALRDERDAKFIHVKGHSGVLFNERADELAVWARHVYSSAEEAGAESVLVKCDFILDNGEIVLSKERNIKRWEGLVLQV